MLGDAKLKRVITIVFSVLVTGCVNLGQVISEDEINRIDENALRHNQTLLNVSMSELLLNILRARDHKPRYYTAVSDIGMNPGGELSGTANVGGLALGNNTGDPWVNFGGSVTGKTNDTLSYTFGNASQSDDKSFAYERFSSETIDKFWKHPWPRAMLIEVLFRQQALKIVDDRDGQTGEARFLDYFDERKHGTGQLPVYSISENGWLQFCFNDIRFCAPASQTVKRRLTEQSVGKDSVTEKYEYTEETKRVWDLSSGKKHMARSTRIADGVAESQDLISILYEGDDRKSIAHFQLIYCSNFELEGASFTTKEGYLSNSSRVSTFAPSGPSRPIRPFVCSTSLADVDADTARPYFLVFEGDHRGIYRPTVNTFDNATYEIGRSLRKSVSEQSWTEQSFCTSAKKRSTKSATGIDEKCYLESKMLQVYEHSNQDPCAPHYLSKVSYQGKVYVAGLPEEGDNSTTDNLGCFVPNDMSSTTLIFLLQLMEDGIKRPENESQIILTQ